MSLKNYSTTAASNNSASPNGAPEGWALSDINNTMRQVMADVRTLAASNTIASAATCDLGSLDETFLTVSGTTTITALGTVSAGIYKFVTFSGILTLTHNGTSLILPGAANITTAAGDTALFESLGSGNWKCHDYTVASLAPGHATSATSATTATNATNLTGTIASGVTATTQAAGDSTTKVATTAFMTGAFTGTNQSLATSGYQKLPGGLIIQWGTVNTAATVPGASVTFSPNFGTAVLFVGAFSVGGNNTANAYSATTTGMSVTTYQGNTGSAVALTVVPWLAIGY